VATSANLRRCSLTRRHRPQDPNPRGAAAGGLDRIERLLTSAPSITPSQDAKLRAVGRTLHKKAPFHRDRNSIADALIIETYRDCVREAGPGERHTFVPHNKTDLATRRTSNCRTMISGDLLPN